MVNEYEEGDKFSFHRLDIVFIGSTECPYFKIKEVELPAVSKVKKRMEMNL